MKAFAIFTFAVAAASAAVINSTEIVEVPSGALEITIDGVSWGYLLDTTEGVRTFDVSGTEYNLQQTIVTRGGVHTIAELIQKWGKPAARLFQCIGAKVVSNCASQFVLCGASGVAPWVCAGGLTCAGPHAVECVQQLTG
ncbi:hypothetical protein VHEMI10704 [[Torrubiella] hemipterigena]|uniref:Uncharacterized protein n=1 Tax=[Torrubiella] hemipterigena TaxID=1531966 RepID=A0A0A1TJF5_9HYPO|nr:hypothetical protein VHEMI10704 [[Torrubiella] hemipterigena]